MMETPMKQTLLEEEPIHFVEPLPMKPLSTKPRERSDSISSISTTTSTVTIRHGRVYDNRPKKKVPHLHKVIALMLVVLIFCVLVPFIYFSWQRGRFGPFRRTAEEEDIYEHEKKVEMDGQDWAGFIFASLMIAVAAGGGIGGGGVLVPTYIFILGFEPKYAIPLSNCTILGSSISNLILNVNKRHDYADRPRIDWDIMLMMEPLTVAGALVGTFVNVLLPPWVISCMLMLLLVATAIKTMKKGIKKYNQETASFERQASLASIKMEPTSNGYATLPATAAAGGDAANLKVNPDRQSAKAVLAWSPAEVKQWWERSLPPGCQEYIHIVDECELDGADLLDLDFISLSQFDVKKMLIMKILRRIKQLKQSLGIPEDTVVNVKKDDGADPDQKASNDDLDPIPEGGADPRWVKAEQEGNQMYMTILKQESVHPPWKVAVMFLCSGGLLALTILKGGGPINLLDIECGQSIYWVLTLGAIPWVLMISVIGRTHLIKRYYEKDECGYEYLPQDVVWDERATIRYPLLCSIAGLAAGMFGIGGGIVKGPLMLEMNVYAPVTSATSATMILFTSTGASVSYLLFEQLNLHYGVILFCLGIVWTLFGQIALNKVVKASGRNSYIILIIGLTVALSAIAMGVESSGALVDLFKGHAEGGGDLCGAGGE